MTDLRVRVSSDLSRPEAPFRWAGWALLGAAAVLLPWTVVLGISLPATQSARHWAVAWIGLDVMETTALAVTGWLVLRRDVRVRIAASAAGAFLLADAWFDITTAQPDLGRAAGDDAGAVGRVASSSCSVPPSPSPHRAGATSPIVPAEAWPWWTCVGKRPSEACPCPRSVRRRLGRVWRSCPAVVAPDPEAQRCRSLLDDPPCLGAASPARALADPAGLPPGGGPEQPPCAPALPRPANRLAQGRAPRARRRLLHTGLPRNDHERGVRRHAQADLATDAPYRLVVRPPGVPGRGSGYLMHRTTPTASPTGRRRWPTSATAGSSS